MRNQEGRGNLCAVCAGLVTLMSLVTLWGQAHGQAHGQAYAQSVAERDDQWKFQDCRTYISSLIGLSRDQLRERCGLYHRHTRYVDVAGTWEIWTYTNIDGSPLLSVYLENGAVVSAGE